ncbi:MULTISPECIES: RHS repeat-associated core domain-containing protein [Pseudomonas]|uniref:RHS repeat-associated core domain-containing protein n=1 Tax=Pseudomonas TaxID=286 RepID=UPI0035CD310A
MHTAYRRRSPAGPGFNGEYVEPQGVQLLGSYRAYNPALMRFHNPDSLSPFGKGGLNAYAYCLGDPVNHGDPTGHLALWAWVKSHPFRMAAASFATGLVTVTVSEMVPNEGAKEGLRWTSAVLLATALAFVVTPLVKDMHRIIGHRRSERRSSMALRDEAMRLSVRLPERPAPVVEHPLPTYDDIATQHQLNYVTPPMSELPSYNSLHIERRRSYDLAMANNQSRAWADSIRDTSV